MMNNVVTDDYSSRIANRAIQYDRVRTANKQLEELEWLQKYRGGKLTDAEIVDILVFNRHEQESVIKSIVEDRLDIMSVCMVGMSLEWYYATATEDIKRLKAHNLDFAKRIDDYDISMLFAHENGQDLCMTVPTKDPNDSIVLTWCTYEYRWKWIGEEE